MEKEKTRKLIDFSPSSTNFSVFLNTRWMCYTLDDLLLSPVENAALSLD